LEKEEYMNCRVCTELERFVHSALEPDDPKLLVGLSEAGKRNREHQHAEKLLKVELDLKRHRKSFLSSETKA
jgi:hypothetical protein